MEKFNSFAALAETLAADRIAKAASDETHAETYAGAFIEHSELAKLSIIDEPVSAEMPDADMVRGAVELAIGTIFDVLNGTRMEEFGQKIAWGIVHSFHTTALEAERQEDHAAQKLGDLVRHFDPSEIHAVEVEETQLLCQTLEGCREALEAMRDHASDVYRVETGRPWMPTRGSKVSRNGVTAGQVDGRNYLAARQRQRTAQFAPTGPLVVVSGSQQWHDVQMLFDMLDNIKKRVPEMVLATTGMRKGVDEIAISWAETRGVTSVMFKPERNAGASAPFKRNEQIVKLAPVEAIICEGSGIQKNLAQRLLRAGVPCQFRRLDDQAPDQGRRRA